MMINNPFKYELNQKDSNLVLQIIIKFIIYIIYLFFIKAVILFYFRVIKFDQLFEDTSFSYQHSFVHIFNLSAKANSFRFSFSKQVFLEVYMIHIFQYFFKLLQALISFVFLLREKILLKKIFIIFYIYLSSSSSNSSIKSYGLKFLPCPLKSLGFKFSNFAHETFSLSKSTLPFKNLPYYLLYGKLAKD